MKRLLLFFLTLLTIPALAQDWSLGLHTGISTILGSSHEVHMPSGDPLMFSPTISGSMKIGYAFSIGNQNSLNVRAGVKRMGAIMTPYPDDYLPRYRITYGEFDAQFMHNFGADSSRMWFDVSGGISGARTLEAWRLYNSGGDIITAEFNPWDAGIQIGAGLNLKLKRGDAFRVSLESYYGMLQLFSGNLEANGLTGKNFYAGIGISYLFLKAH